MDKKIKAKWLKALRSGKYKQGKHFLKDDAGAYCCLGVLCDVLKVAPRGAVLSTEAQKLSGVNRDGGLPENAPPIYYGINAGTLAGFNDKGLSFKRIAQLIERYL